MPRINKRNAQICEMTGMAGGEGCFARGGDAGDLDVADLDRSTDLLHSGSDCGRGFRGSPVEWQHAAVEDLVDGAIEGGREPVAAAAGR